MPDRKPKGPTKAKTKHLTSNKKPAIFGWCLPHAGHKGCPFETAELVCYCKCHKERK